MRADRRFPCTAESVPQARRFTKETLTAADEGMLERVLLMVSELATNSVRHAGTAFLLSIEDRGVSLRIAVTDESVLTPQLQHPSPAEPTGRGLQIIQALADDFGFTSTDPPHGKTVWFTLAHPRDED